MKKSLPLVFPLIMVLYSCLMAVPDLPEKKGGENPTDTPAFWPSIPPDTPEIQQITNNLEMDIIPVGTDITLSAVNGSAEVYWQLISASSPPGSFTASGSNSCIVSFTEQGEYILYAKSVLSGSDLDPLYSWKYSVKETFPVLSEEGVNCTNSRIVGWADGYSDYNSSDAYQYTDPAQALGAADDTNLDVVSLGNGGSITLTFTRGIGNGNGWDFAVFENGLLGSSTGIVFTETAFVEVSSNGTDFIRFHNISLQQDPVPSYDSLPQGLYRGLAGNMPFGYGTPFDLNLLINRPEVTSGLVNLKNITCIRIIDIPGTGDAPAPGDDDLRRYDSTGGIIYDPWETYGSAGFDLDGIAVFNLGEN